MTKTHDAYKSWPPIPKRIPPASPTATPAEIPPG